MTQIDAVVYRAVPVHAFAVGGAQALLVSERFEGAIPVAGVVPAILTLCLPPRSLSAHEAVVLSALTEFPPDTLRSFMRSMIAAGLIEQVDSRGGLGKRPDGKIEALAIITKNRPKFLKRCLKSCLEQLRLWSRTLEVLVIDDSELDIEAENRSTIVSSAKEHGVRIVHLGAEYRRAINQQFATLRLTASVGNRREVSDVTDGAAHDQVRGRNVLLLATAGQRIIAVDDSVVVEPWMLSATGGELEVVGHVDPREYGFGEWERTDRINAVSADLIGLHETMLGLDVADLISMSTRCDVRRACGHLNVALEAPTKTGVRVTMSGVAGDSGVQCPYTLLFRGGKVQAQFAASADALRSAMAFRTGNRIVRHATVAHEPLFELKFTGLDNRALLPPFADCGADLDSAYGTILSVGDPASMLGHVPCGVVDSPDRSHTYESTVIPSATRASFGELIASALAEMRFSPWSTHDSRLRTVGEHLRSVSECDVKQWAHFIRKGVIRRRAAQLGDIEEFLGRGNLATHVRTAVTRYRATLLEKVSLPEFIIPAGWMSDASWEQCADGLRAEMAAYGRLLLDWGAAWRFYASGSVPPTSPNTKTSGTSSCES